MTWMIRWIRSTAVSVAAVTMLIQPLAQGAAVANVREEMIKEFIKVNKLSTNHPVTVGEFNEHYRGWLPAKLRGKMDLWAAVHRDELMPRMTAEKVKDGFGVDQIRINIELPGNTVSFTTGEDFVKTGNEKLVLSDFYNTESLTKKIVSANKFLLDEQPKRLSQVTFPKLTGANLAKMSKRSRAKFLVLMRLAYENSLTIQTAREKQDGFKTSSMSRPVDYVIANWLMGQPAFALKVGESCLVAGYLSTYGQNLSCGGQTSGAQNLSNQVNAQFGANGIFPQAQNTCASSGNGLTCNPIVYGFDSSNSAYCTGSARQAVLYATQSCGSQVPIKDANNKFIPENVAKLLASMYKAQNGKDPGLKLSPDGKLSDKQYESVVGYLNQLIENVKSSIAFCDSPAGIKLQAKVDEKNACDAIKLRLVELETFKEQAHGAVCTGDLVVANEGDTACVCAPGSHEKKNHDKDRAKKGASLFHPMIHIAVGENAFAADTANLPDADDATNDYKQAPAAKASDAQTTQVQQQATAAPRQLQPHAKDAVTQKDLPPPAAAVAQKEDAPVAADVQAGPQCEIDNGPAIAPPLPIEEKPLADLTPQKDNSCGWCVFIFPVVIFGGILALLLSLGGGHSTATTLPTTPLCVTANCYPPPVTAPPPTLPPPYIPPTAPPTTAAPASEPVNLPNGSAPSVGGVR